MSGMENFDILSDAAWEQICQMLNHDLEGLDNKGICIVASCDGGEPDISVAAETDRMNWIVNQVERPLSRAILDDNPHYPNSDEIERMIGGLRVTITRLELALANRRAADARPMSEPPAPSK